MATTHEPDVSHLLSDYFGREKFSILMHDVHYDKTYVDAINAIILNLTDLERVMVGIE